MATPTIKISVSQADATLVQTCTLTAGMQNLPIVKFSFADEWTGLGKTAVVRAGSVCLEVLVVGNQITVPYECLETAGVNLIIGVYGTDTAVAIPTVWCSCGEILDGTDVEEPSNVGEATPSLVDQMIAYAGDIEAIAETLDGLAIRTVTVNTDGANHYGIASVTLADSGSGEDRTLTFYFSNIKGNGIESITWSASGTYRGRIQITESNGNVTNFDALIDAIDYLESLINLAEAYAKGTINDVDVEEGEPGYQDNAKYYAEMAGEAEEGAEAAQEAAETAQGKAEDAQEAAEAAQTAAETAQGLAEDAATSASGDAGSAAGSASSAAGSASSASDSASAAASARDAAELAQTAAESSASAASGSASSASTQALKSEGYAVGTQNGSGVASGSTYYHNNSKYYSEQASSSASSASGSASSASDDASAASSSASSASTNALKAEGYAVGKQNGTDVASGSPYYENNAKYYADEASDSAAAAAASAATFETDTTLAVSGKAADAKATGDAITSQSEKIADELEDSVNCTNILEPYFLHGTVGPSGRKFKIDGNKYINTSGTGSAYHCYNLVSKTNALHYGTGTSSGITSFFDTYKNDVWLPISLIASPNFQYDIYAVVKNKIKANENKTIFRLYAGNCTVTDGNITAVNSFNLLINLSDNTGTPNVCSYISGASLSQYTHFSLMIESMLPHAQETEFNIYRLRHPPYNGYITQYNFLTFKATAAVPAGRLIMVGNQLYKATTAIANGATLTPNTNITATTLDAVISAL